MKIPPPTSKFWKFFKRCNDSKTAKCQLCEVELTYTGGTTNRLNHIRLKHSVKDESAPGTPDKQSSVISFLRSSRARHLSGKQTDEITNAIVNMIVLDYLPLSLVEGKGFLKLSSVVAPDYKVPTRNTIKSRTEKTYDE